MTTLGQRFLQLRRERGWTLDELSKRSDIGSGHLSLIERDHYKQLGVFTVRKLARAYGISLDDLMEGVNDPAPRGSG